MEMGMVAMGQGKLSPRWYNQFCCKRARFWHLTRLWTLSQFFLHSLSKFLTARTYLGRLSNIIGPWKEQGMHEQ